MHGFPTVLLLGLFMFTNCERFASFGKIYVFFCEKLIFWKFFNKFTTTFIEN